MAVHRHAVLTLAFIALSMLLGISVGADIEPQIEIRAREQRPMRAFIGLGPVPLELVITSKEFKDTGAIADVNLLDSDGKPVDSKGIGISIKPSIDIPLQFVLFPFDYGYFTVHVDIHSHDGKLIGSHKTSIGVLRPLTERQMAQDSSKSIFGVNFHFDHGQGDLDVIPRLMSMAGVKWVRDSINWQSVEQVKGDYRVKPYLQAAYPLLLQRYGIRTLGILCYDNPGLYSHGTAEEAEAFGRYSEYLADALTGTVDHFEIWNEPSSFSVLRPDQYVQVLKSGYEGVKKGNSKAFVVGIGGAAPGGWSGHYIPEIRKQNAAGFMDAFSIHPYTAPTTCDVGYRTEGAPAPLSNLEYANQLTLNFADDIRKVKKMRKAPGIWITEMGWPSNVNGLMGQAQQTARAFIMTAVQPDVYERLFLYDFLCDGPNPNESEHNFGMVGYDYSIRPSYVAYSTVSRALEGRKLIRRISHPDESVRIYIFGPSNDPLLVGWITEVTPSELIAGKLKDGKPIGKLHEAGSSLDKGHIVRMRIGSNSVRLCDWQDRVSRRKAVNGIVELPLSTSPIYVSGISDQKSISISE